MQVADAVSEPVPELRDLVIVRREQRARTGIRVPARQALGDRPRERQPVERGCATPDLVEDDQRIARGVVEDVRGLRHLDHERGLAAVQRVVGAHAGEHAVAHTDRGAIGGHETPRLSQHHQQRRLADVRALARHVRAGDQRQARRRTLGPELAVVGHEALPDRLIQHRVPPGVQRQRTLPIDLRARPAPMVGLVGKPEQHVQLRDRVGVLDHVRHTLARPLAQPIEQHPLALERDARGVHNPVLELLELGRDVPLRVLEGLLAGELGRRTLGLPARQLDVVAEHLVVADLHPGQIVRCHHLGLIPGQPRARVTLKPARLVQTRIHAVADHAPLTEVPGRILHACLGDGLAKGFQGPRVLAEPAPKDAERLGSPERHLQLFGDQHRSRQRREVTRRRTPQRHPPGDPRDIRHPGERLARPIAQRPIAHERAHRVVAGTDRPRIPRRRCQPRTGQPLAHRGAHHAPLADRAGQEHPRERALELAIADRPLDLEGTQARRIDAADPLSLDHTRRPHMGECDTLALELPAAGRLGRLTVHRLRLAEVADHRAGRERAVRVRVDAEPVHAAHTEQIRDRFERFLGAVLPGGTPRPGRAERCQEPPDPRRGLAGARLGVENLRHAPAGEFIGDLARIAVQDLEQTGREFDHRGTGRVVALERDRRERHGLLVGQHRFVDERARRDDLGDATVDHPLGVLGVLELVDDGDPVPVLDRTLEIRRLLVVRDPGDRDAVAAIDHREPERTPHRLRVGPEELVEIAHPEEQHAVGVLFLAAGPLLHRRRAVRVLSHRTDRIGDRRARQAPNNKAPGGPAGGFARSVSGWVRALSPRARSRSQTPGGFRPSARPAVRP